jgi:WD40 repeat protein
MEKQFEPVAVLIGHSNAITSLSFCPNPKYPILLTTSEDGTIRLWDVTDFSKEVSLLSFP